MGGAAPMTWLACALGVAAMISLRFAWSRARRSVSLNGVSWGILAAAVILAWNAEGAWGVAVTGLAAMSAALIMLGLMAAKSPPGRAKASNRRVGMLPEEGEPRKISQRIATFVIVMIGGFAVALGLAIAVRGLGDVIGWSEANVNALAFYAVPISWAALATILLMQRRRRSQITTLLACGLTALPFLIVGSAS